ncbi:MAG: hypothetical protein WA532_09875 [Candidatus Korobacteraceae bacterium]
MDSATSYIAPCQLASPERSGSGLGLFVRLVLLAVLAGTPAYAVTPAVTVVPPIVTVTGNGTAGYQGDSGPATGAELNSPYGVTMDAAGNLYIADTANNVVRKVSAANGEVTTAVGGGTGCAQKTDIVGDNCLAASATLNQPYAVAADALGNLYIADYGDQRIRMVNASTLIITTVAGTGTQGYSGDTGIATAAELNSPISVALDGNGNLYIADSGNNRIRMVNASTHKITTLAGNGTLGYNDGPATGAEFSSPTGVAVDVGGGIVYVADQGNNRIRKLNTGAHSVSTVAGTGSAGYGGDNGAAAGAILDAPFGVALDAAGNLYIADRTNNRIREVNAATQIIATVAGNGTQAYGGDGGAATIANLDLPEGIALDALGNIYIADRSNERVRKVVVAAANLGAVSIGPSSSAQNIFLSINRSLTISSVTVPASQGGVQEFVPGTVAGCVVDGMTSIPAGTICTVPVSFSPGYPGLRRAPLVVQTSAGSAQFGLSGTGQGPQIAVLPGVITTSAGTGTAGYSGDGSGSSAAQLNQPTAVATDAAGNLYFADYANNVVREVNASTQNIITVAGTGTQGDEGDNSAATSAELSSPMAVALDAAGNLYIADYGNSRIRMVNPATGIITTVAGNGTAGYSGDNSAATNAELSSPVGLALDAAGNLYIADYGNNRIREVNAFTQIITTIAGNGTAGYSGDSGSAAAAELNQPTGVALDTAGDLFIADSSNSVIREVSAATQTITTVAGNGDYSYDGDGGPATSAALAVPTGIAIDAADNLYIADWYYNVIRKVDAASQVINTIAGNATQGDTTELSLPYGVALDALGNLYVADSGSNRILEVSASAVAPLSFQPTIVNDPTAFQDVTVSNTGNENLTISSMSVASNFLLGSDTTCSASGPVATGATCILGIELAPEEAGDISGSIVLTENALNNPSNTLTIELSGSGMFSQVITLSNPGTQTYGVQPITLTESVPSGLPISNTVISGPATVSGNTLTITGVGTVVVQAAQAGNTDYSPANPVLVSFTVNPAPLSVTATNISVPFGMPIPQPTGVLTGVVGSDGITANYGTTATQGAPVAPYPITATLNDPNNKLSNYTVTTTNGTVNIIPAILAYMISPTPGTVLPGGPTATSTSLVTFSWNPGLGVTEYMLSVGSGEDTFDLGTYVTNNTSYTIAIPNDGVALWVRLHSKINGVWQYYDSSEVLHVNYHDYSYTEAGTTVPAALTSPVPGTQLTGTSATFSWTPGAGPSAYMLYLGTNGKNSNDLLDSGSISTTSVMVSNLPTTGVTVYATLYSKLNGTWSPSYYTYTAQGTPVPASLTSPGPETQLPGANATFSWTQGTGVTAYMLYLGTTGKNSNDLLNSGSLTTNSYAMSNLPTNGVTVYATLYSKINGAWSPSYYTYTEAGTPVPASLTSPAPETQLPGANATFSWTQGTGVTAYMLYLGTQGINSADLLDSGSITAGSITSTSYTVSNLPTTGVMVYATLYSKINGAWVPSSYTYTAQGTPVPAALTSPTPGNQLTGTSANFSWSQGTGVAAYMLCVGTQGVNSTNLLNSGSTTANSVAVPNLPTTGMVYATLYSKINGAWVPSYYTYTTQGSFVPAALTSPVPGTQLTGTSATFSWTQGTGVTAYMLYLGTKGSNSTDLLDSGVITVNSVGVSNLPTTGVMVYATLYSKINGAWVPSYYTYTAQGNPVPAALINPAPGTQLPGASATFSWTPGTGVTAYMLYLGTKGSNSTDLLDSGLITAGPISSTSYGVSNLPTTGVMVYATLYSKINGVWVPSSYTYTAW